MAFNEVGRLVRWFGGGDETILSDVPSERPSYEVTGGAVLLIPFLAAVGMTLRIESMVGLSWLESAATAGLLTYVVIVTIETALVRNLKNPLPVGALPPELVKQHFRLGIDPVNVEALLPPRPSRRNELLVDLLRVLMAASVGFVTTHALLEFLYDDDIAEFKQEQLDEERTKLETSELLGPNPGSVVSRYGSWVTQAPAANPESAVAVGAEAADEGAEVQTFDITGEAAWALLQRDVDTAESNRVNNLITAAEGRLEDVEAEIKQVRTTIDEYEAAILIETQTGQNGRGPTCGGVCEDLIDLQRPSVELLGDPRDGLDVDTLYGRKAAIDQEIEDLQTDLADASSPTQTQLATARNDVLAGWNEFRGVEAEIEERTTFDEEDLGIAERSTILFSVMFDSWGAAVVGVALLLALFLMDILPYSLKRLNARAHDTLLILSAMNSIGQARLEHVQKATTFAKEEVRLSDLVLPAPPSGDPASSTPFDSELQLPPGWSKQRVFQHTFEVNRADPLRRSPIAVVYEARRDGKDCILKEPRQLPADREPTKKDRQEYRERLSLMRNEIEQYLNLNNDPHFPRLLANDQSHGLLALEFKERLSVDHYLFGQISAISTGELPTHRDVPASFVIAWMLHLLDGVSIFWRSGKAFVDGHPSNTLIEGRRDAPTFESEPFEALPSNAGYMKLVDFGSVAVLNEEATIYGRRPYLPPEYENPDHGHVPTIEGDVYSVLGCVGYYLLTGSDPQHHDPVAIHRHTTSPAELNPRAPRPLVRLVETLMENRPEDRILGAAQSDTVARRVDALEAMIRATHTDLKEHDLLDALVFERGKAPSEYIPRSDQSTEEL